LDNNKLKSVSYEDIKRETFMLSSFFLKETSYRHLVPFEKFLCDRPFEIFVIFPYLESKDVRVTKTCMALKFFDMGVLRTTFTDRSQADLGYTKIGISKIYLYNRNLYKFTKTSITDKYRIDFKKSDENRLIDTIFNEENFKTDDIDCRIFIKTAKDYNANNRGKNKYLIFDYTMGLCFTKKSEMVVVIENSNRYPESKANDVDTLRELKETLKTLKVIK
jgi:hypothetical protein